MTLIKLGRVTNHFVTPVIFSKSCTYSSACFRLLQLSFQHLCVDYTLLSIDGEGILTFSSGNQVRIFLTSNFCTKMMRSGDNCEQNTVLKNEVFSTTRINAQRSGCLKIEPVRVWPRSWKTFMEYFGQERKFQNKHINLLKLAITVNSLSKKFIAWFEFSGVFASRIQIPNKELFC